MLEELKEKVYSANLELYKRGVVIYTWGNVSEIDRERSLIIIKPSGITYNNMTPDDMVVVDLKGNVVEGRWNPSSDTQTHIELYKEYGDIGGICHTHSTNAVAFAQAGHNIPALGTTHADYFYGDILCSRSLTDREVNETYERNTGKVIVETLNENLNKENILAVPGILVKNHGPFTWGRNAENAVYHSIVLEEIATMCIKTLVLNPDAEMPKYIMDKHYWRKHGKNAYYGQGNGG